MLDVQQYPYRFQMSHPSAAVWLLRNSQTSTSRADGLFYFQFGAGFSWPFMPILTWPGTYSSTSRYERSTKQVEQFNSEKRQVSAGPVPVDTTAVANHSVAAAKERPDTSGQWKVWNTGNGTDPLLIAHPAVEEAKSYLGNLYGYTPEMDEFYGAKSADVVAQFQKTFMGDQLQNGTVQAGVLDQQTLDRLRQAYENKHNGVWDDLAKAKERDGQTGYGVGPGTGGSVGVGGSGGFGCGGSSGVENNDSAESQDTADLCRTNESGVKVCATVPSAYFGALGEGGTHHSDEDWGWRVNPISGATPVHHGADFNRGIMKGLNPPVFSVMDGKVNSITTTCTIGDLQCNRTYGNQVVVQHADGSFTTYNHLSSVDVGVKQTVAAGQKIESVGTTGWSTGDHLHFEHRLANGEWDPDKSFLENTFDVDPMGLIPGGMFPGTN
jgi:hypothetical protein